MSDWCQKSIVASPKIRVFESRPKGDELAAPIGYGEMGSSGIRGHDTEHSFIIRPTKIPIVFAAFSVYAAVAIGMGMAIWTKDVFAFAIAGFAAIVIGPFLLGVFVWINRSMGENEYLYFDKTADIVILPRVPIEIPVADIVEAVYIDIHGDHQQLCLVANHEEKWIYCHVYNGGEDHRPDKTLARILDCENSYKYYSRKEIKRVLGCSIFDYPTQLPISSKFNF